MVLVACGGRALTSGDFELSAGTGGALDAQGGASGGSAAGARDPGGAGHTAAGAGPTAPANTQVAGRWGMFAFEDQVGVWIRQSAATLTGSGCIAGAPPVALANTNCCGDLSGTVSGREASFGFVFGTINEYRAEVTVSANGRRMTGAFRGAYDWLAYPTAWLPIADEEPWLTGNEIASPSEGEYWLIFTSADDGGTEYGPNTAYRLSYSSRGIASDLGSFFHSEMKRIAPGGTIRVGPVPITSPELAVQLDIYGIDDAFTEVTAITGSGHHYTFELKREVN